VELQERLEPELLVHLEQRELLEQVAHKDNLVHLELQDKMVELRQAGLLELQVRAEQAVQLALVLRVPLGKVVHRVRQERTDHREQAAQPELPVLQVQLVLELQVHLEQLVLVELLEHQEHLVLLV
jgi:hypothetical protein